MEEFSIPDTHRFLMDQAPEYSLQVLEADLQVDLVIVGAISRSIISDVIVGNTTEKVLDFLECDALLLRPD